MLGRFAARAALRHPSLRSIPRSPIPVVPSLVAIRAYADKPQRPSRPSPYDHQDASGSAAPRGPIPNKTWAPDQGINFRPRRSSKVQGYNEEPVPEEEPVKSSSSTQTEQPRSQSEEPSTADSETPKPTGPLPDLRQGIPSTFDAEFSDRTSSFKSKEADPADINITEDPAEGGGRSRPGGELPKEAYVSSIERRRNVVARYMYLTAFGFFAASAVWLGQNWETEDEAKLHPDVPNGWWPGAFWGRIKIRTSQMLGYYTEPAFPKLLPDTDPNFAPPFPYTLVLSLEDLLVSSKWDRQKGWQVAKRPGVDKFLRYLSAYYELVIFTTVPSINADMVIKKLDPFHIIMYPLFREGTRYVNGEHVKDLSYLNRDLSKTLIIDTVPAHVQLQPENAIVLPKWDGTREDKHAGDLLSLVPFLEYIASMSIEDVRKVIKSFEGTDIPTEFAKREARAREAFNKQLAEEKAKKGKVGSLAGSVASALGFKSGPQLPGEQSPAEAYAQGKMISDQMRERGMRQYEDLEKQIRENGEKWLAEIQAEEKKMMDESMKSMQSGMTSWSGRLFGSGGSDENNKRG